MGSQEQAAAMLVQAPYEGIHNGPSSALGIVDCALRAVALCQHLDDKRGSSGSICNDVGPQWKMLLLYKEDPVALIKFKVLCYQAHATD